MCKQKTVTNLCHVCGCVFQSEERENVCEYCKKDYNYLEKKYKNFITWIKIKYKRVTHSMYH